MIIPDFSKEKGLILQGFRAVVGVDEAGRGPWAGPVVAGAVVLGCNDEVAAQLIESGVRDSKKISEKKREKLYGVIVSSVAAWGVGIVSEKVIDEINILNATKLAMRKAIASLSVAPDFLILDGNMLLEDFPARQLAVPRADQTVLSVSAASILAKVTRDRIMNNLDAEYPEYGFFKHKGYGTPFHIQALKEFGPSDIHRKSFRPIREFGK